MTYKQVETSREIRLWITQVVIPAGAVVVTALTIPEVRQAASEKVNGIRESIKRKLKKD